MIRPLFPRFVLALAIVLAMLLSVRMPRRAEGSENLLVPTSAAEYDSDIKPFLKSFCLDCHHAEHAEAKFRVDNLDGMVTKGQDVERWEKVLEMLSIGDMPPAEADAQPAKHLRHQITTWIANELKKINRGPDESRLVRPAFGNRVDHEALFSGEHQGPAYSPSRLWRKNPQIHRQFEKGLRLPAGTTPFPPKGGHGFQDYAFLLAEESTIKALRISARNYIAEILDGRLIHPRKPDGKPDKTRQVREGRSRWSEFNSIVHSEQELTDQLVAEAVKRAFELLLNRSPTSEESKRYAVFLTESIAIAGKREGLENLLTAVILSPEFIYRQELGLGETLPDGRRRLSPHEIAYAIAFALTDAPPDDQLMRAMSAGNLKTAADVEREVRRMLAASTREYWDYEINHTFESHVEACPNPRILRFFREFFGYSGVFDVFKDQTRNPHHKPQFLFKDADLFVLSILEEDRQVLRELLTSDRYIVHYVSPEKGRKKIEQFRADKKRYAAQNALLDQGMVPVLGGYRGGKYYTTYGFDPEHWNYPIEQPFPVANRAGMLTHPAWLVAHSGNFDTDPIRRGKWIREHLLADVIPDIPIGVDAALQDDPHKTLRERLEKTTAQECWRCHKKMNPLGLPFESFDDFGRFREQLFFDAEGKFAGTYYERENRLRSARQRKKEPEVFTGRALDTTGSLTGTGEATLDGDVQDAFELVERLARSERVRQSFVRHAFRYWMGRNETLDDSPTLIAADHAYVESDGSFKELLVSLLTSDSFLLRR